MQWIIHSSILQILKTTGQLPQCFLDLLQKFKSHRTPPFPVLVTFFVLSNVIFNKIVESI